MANRRVLVKRRKAVRNIRKITRTMQLIATARFQAALNRVVAARPFNDKVAELAADIARAAGGLDHPLLKPNEGTKVTDLLVLTGDRGLAGGYNANVLRAAIAHLDEQTGQGLEPRVHMVGKKGIAYFRFLRRPVAQQTSGIGDRPRFEQVEPIANELIDRYLRGEIASAHVAYMRFLSAGQQRPMVVQVLPLQPDVKEKGKTVDYEFSPGPQELLDELLPSILRVKLFQAFNEAVASEQVARMVAMKAATDAAGDMIKALTREYNRARQTHITMELLDIVGGANALS